jgi:hypothetical protein
MDIAQTARELVDEKYPMRGHRTGEVIRSMLVALAAAEQRATDAEALLREADSWLSLAAHRLASETPKVGEPSRADILAMCAKIAAFLASKGATT